MTFENIGPSKIITMGNLLSQRFEPLEWIIHELLPENRNLFFSVCRSIDYFCFSALMVYSLVAGKHFPPLKVQKQRNVLLVLHKSYLPRVNQLFSLELKKNQSGPMHYRLTRNLQILPVEYGDLCLNSFHGHNQFLDLVPTGTDCVVFIDAHRMLSNKRKLDETNHSEFSRFLSKLNAEGVASMVFFKQNSKISGEFADELFLNSGDRMITLSENPMALKEYGGGCIVERQKVSDTEEIPLQFAFWYTIIDGALNHGWELLNPANCGDLSKKIEMFERQKRVQEMLEKRVPQKEIAAELGVDPSTVTRDVQKIKAAGKLKVVNCDSSDSEE